MLVLVIGDFHIPHRSIDIPPKFKKLLVPGKIHKILSTGNLTSISTFEYLSSICPDLQIMNSEFDDPSFPSHSSSTSKIVEIENTKFGLVCGYTVIPFGDKNAFGILARELGVNVVISGGSHFVRVFQEDGVVFIDPGSATGAFKNVENAQDYQIIPSFVLLDLKEDLIVVVILLILVHLQVYKRRCEGGEAGISCPSSHANVAESFTMNEDVSENLPDDESLSKDREISSIPTMDNKLWVYPSQFQFYSAMQRKNQTADPKLMSTIIPIHNIVNEQCWKKITNWEKTYAGQCEPKLKRFSGNSSKYTPRAWMFWICGFKLPFDRHDWVCGQEVTYVIDFYHGPLTKDGASSVFLDVRPVGFIGYFNRAHAFVMGYNF